MGQYFSIEQKYGCFMIVCCGFFLCVFFNQFKAEPILQNSVQKLTTCYHQLILQF